MKRTDVIGICLAGSLLGGIALFFIPVEYVKQLTSTQQQAITEKATALLNACHDESGYHTKQRSVFSTNRLYKPIYQNCSKNSSAIHSKKFIQRHTRKDSKFC